MRYLLPALLALGGAAYAGGTTTSDPDIAIDDLLLNFGEVSPPNTGTRWFVVSNVGGETLTISSAVQDGSTAFVILNDLAGDELDPGHARNVYVYFQPTHSLIDEGWVTYQTNDPDEPEVTVSFVGNPYGVEAETDETTEDTGRADRDAGGSTPPEDTDSGDTEDTAGAEDTGSPYDAYKICAVSAGGTSVWLLAVAMLVGLRRRRA